MKNPQQHQLESISVTTFWTVLCLIVLVGLALTAYAAWNGLPIPDEGSFANASHRLAHQGIYGTTIFETAGTQFLRFHERTYWAFPLLMMIQAFWMWLGGPEGLFALRMLSGVWLSVSITTLALFLLRRGAPRAVALLAAALLATNFHIIQIEKLARPDGLCQALGFSSLLAYVSIRERAFRPALLVSQALSALALLSHPNGILHFTCLAALVLTLDHKRLTLWLVVTAGLVHLTIYSPWLAYIALDPEAFASQIRENSIDRYQRSLNPILALWREINDRYLVAYGLRDAGGAAALKALVLVAQWGAVAACLLNPKWRRETYIRELLMFCGLTFSIQLFFNQKIVHYLIHIIPFYCAMLAAVVVSLWTTAQNRSLMRRGLAVGIATLMFVQIGATLKRGQQTHWAGTSQEIAAFMQRNATGAKLIFGDAGFEQTLDYDPRLLEDRFLGLKSGKQGDILMVQENLLRQRYFEFRPLSSSELAAVRDRARQYVLVFQRPGVRILFHPRLLPVAEPDPPSKWSENEDAAFVRYLGWAADSR